MRIVKQRLLEMLPDARVFLDVDDLKEGKGAEYIDVSCVTLVFVSGGYFHSANCMRELLRAAVTEKPVIALLELEAKHGGIDRSKVLELLREADPSISLHLPYISPSISHRLPWLGPGAASGVEQPVRQVGAEQRDESVGVRDAIRREARGHPIPTLANRMEPHRCLPGRPSHGLATSASLLDCCRGTANFPPHPACAGRLHAADCRGSACLVSNQQAVERKHPQEGTCVGCQGGLSLTAL